MIFTLILGLILRLVNLNQSFWLDEAISVIAANKFSYIELITTFPKYDFHPPLFYIILKFWGSIFGYSEIAARALPVFFGLATIWVVYKIAKEINLNAVWVALLLATSPLHVYYSQEVRMYPLVTFFVLLSFLYFIKLLKKDKFSNWLVFSLSVVAFMSLDYVPIFILPVYWLAPLLYKNKILSGTIKKSFYGKLFLAFIPLIILFIFWLPTLVGQITSGRELAAALPLWKRIIGSPTFKELALVWVKFIVGRITSFHKIIYAAVVIVFSVPYGYFFLNGLKEGKKYLAFWIFIPLSLGFLFSFYVPAFSYFRFLFLLPAFYLIVVSGLKSRLAITTLIIINLCALGVYYVNQNNWREEWREAVAFVEKNAEENEIVLFDFKEPVAGYEWYAKGMVAAYGTSGKRIEDLIDSKKHGVWYFEYLADITDPKRVTLSELKSQGFNTLQEFSFRGVGKIVYLRRM